MVFHFKVLQSISVCRKMHCNKHVHVFHVDRRGKDKQIAEKFK